MNERLAYAHGINDYSCFATHLNILNTSYTNTRRLSTRSNLTWILLVSSDGFGLNLPTRFGFILFYFTHPGL